MPADEGQNHDNKRGNEVLAGRVNEFGKWDFELTRVVCDDGSIAAAHRSART